MRQKYLEIVTLVSNQSSTNRIDICHAPSFVLSVTSRWRDKLELKLAVRHLDVKCYLAIALAS
jgi:hypothetical protein